jgi:hypothetical protein
MSASRRALTRHPRQTQTRSRDNECIRFVRQLYVPPVSNLTRARCRTSFVLNMPSRLKSHDKADAKFPLGSYLISI